MCAAYAVNYVQLVTKWSCWNVWQ